MESVLLALVTTLLGGRGLGLLDAGDEEVGKVGAVLGALAHDVLVVPPPRAVVDEVAPDLVPEHAHDAAARLLHGGCVPLLGLVLPVDAVVALADHGHVVLGPVAAAAAQLGGLHPGRHVAARGRGAGVALELDQEVVLHPLAQQRTEAGLVGGARVHEDDVQGAPRAEAVVDLGQDDGHVVHGQHGAHAQAGDRGEGLGLEVGEAEVGLQVRGVDGAHVGEELALRGDDPDLGQADGRVQTCEVRGGSCSARVSKELLYLRLERGKL